jgi:hypothetical protein
LAFHFDSSRTCSRTLECAISKFSSGLHVNY